MAKQTARDIRRNNRLAVLQHIYASSTISRQDLTQLSGLSPATVANVVVDLIEAGIVIESGYVDSQGGRPRAMLTINSAGGAFVGIDIAETYIHFELFNLSLNRLYTVEHMLHAEENQPDQLCDHLVNGINELLAQATRIGTAVLGIGISVPGLVKRAGGVSVFAPNWGWHDVPLTQMLRAQIHLPLYLDNPLKAIAVAELWFGAGRGIDHLVSLNIGTGVGAGIVVNGELYRGTTNSAGEWGHTTIVLDGRACRCGSQGCLEAYVGAPGIIAWLQEFDPSSTLLHSNDQTATIAALADAAGQRDPLALQVIQKVAHCLGAGIANMINLFNPQVVVIGGWVGVQLGRYLLPDVQRFVEQYALKHPFAATTIQLCELPYNPVSIGAATFALEGFLSTVDTVSAANRS